MGGAFSIGGLVSGIDSNKLIAQLIRIERQPILRLQQRILQFEAQQESIKELRTQLLSLRNLMKDIQLGLVFDKFATTSTAESVVTAAASSSNPVSGSFQIDVLQLASATSASSSARLGAAINIGAALNASGITTVIEAGTFTINGIQFNVDPSIQSLVGIMSAINSSGAGVSATYDAVTDTISLENVTPGDTSIINLGASDDTSNILTALKLNNAFQTTGMNGSTVVTSRTNLGAIGPGDILSASSYANGAIVGGSFSINGVAITMDPGVDSLSDVLARINASDAGVTASYDVLTDTIRVVSGTLGSRTISFTSGTSNFLDITNLTTAIQTAGSDSQVSIDGGPVVTQNTNEVSGALSGVTLSLLSVGMGTINIAVDDAAITEVLQEFIDTFNESVSSIAELTGRDGDLANDNSIRSLGSFFRTNIFQQVTGIEGNFESLLDIGISTGTTFSAESQFQLQIDAEKLSAAILENRGAVQDLFSNDGETGVLDHMFDFLDNITSISGFLNDRSRANGSIDNRIRSFDEQIERMERRVAQREERLRRQFLRLETMTGSLQTQAASLGAFGFQLGGF